MFVCGYANAPNGWSAIGGVESFSYNSQTGVTLVLLVFAGVLAGRGGVLFGRFVVLLQGGGGDDEGRELRGVGDVGIPLQGVATFLGPIGGEGDGVVGTEVEVLPEVTTIGRGLDQLLVGSDDRPRDGLLATEGVFLGLGEDGDRADRGDEATHLQPEGLLAGGFGVGRGDDGGRAFAHRRSFWYPEGTTCPLWGAGLVSHFRNTRRARLGGANPPRPPRLSRRVAADNLGEISSGTPEGIMKIIRRVDPGRGERAEGPPPPDLPGCRGVCAATTWEEVFESLRTLPPHPTPGVPHRVTRS